MADYDSGPSSLVPSANDPDSATNRGPQAQTIQPIPTPDTGDQDVRSLPSNGAIPDEIRGLMADPGYHVP